MRKATIEFMVGGSSEDIREQEITGDVIQRDIEEGLLEFRAYEVSNPGGIKKLIESVAVPITQFVSCYMYHYEEDHTEDVDSSQIQVESGRKLNLSGGEEDNDDDI